MHSHTVHLPLGALLTRAPCVVQVTSSLSFTNFVDDKPDISFTDVLWPPIATAEYPSTQVPLRARI